MFRFSFDVRLFRFMKIRTKHSHTPSEFIYIIFGVDYWRQRIMDAVAERKRQMRMFPQNDSVNKKKNKMDKMLGRIWSRFLAP